MTTTETRCDVCQKQCDKSVSGDWSWFYVMGPAAPIINGMGRPQYDFCGIECLKEWVEGRYFKEFPYADRDE